MWHKCTRNVPSCALSWAVKWPYMDILLEQEMGAVVRWCQCLCHTVYQRGGKAVGSIRNTSAHFFRGLTCVATRGHCVTMVRMEEDSTVSLYLLKLKEALLVKCNGNLSSFSQLLSSGSDCSQVELSTCKPSLCLEASFVFLVHSVVVHVWPELEVRVRWSQEKQESDCVFYFVKQNLYLNTDAEASVSLKMLLMLYLLPVHMHMDSDRTEPLTATLTCTFSPAAMVRYQEKCDLKELMNLKITSENRKKKNLQICW